MGSEGREKGSLPDELPSHLVDVPAFELAEFQVTQGLWKAVYSMLSRRKREKFEILKLSSNPSWFRAKNRPVELISWRDVRAFCNELSHLTGITYRIPSEAEWEYAARCGKIDTNYSGSDFLEEVGWNFSNSGAETMPIGLLYPNDWGLYDMSGNIWEWCEKHRYLNYEGIPIDGSPSLNYNEFDNERERINERRIARGGSWLDIASSSNIFQAKFSRGTRFKNMGFRLAAEIS
jgi:formylglycine-generating enzyme required for sulfatase activity